MSDDRWIEFRDLEQRRQFLRRLQVTGPAAALLCTASVFLRRSGSSLFEQVGWVALPIGALEGLAVVGFLVAVAYWQTRPFAVDPERGRLRGGSRSFAVESVTVAQLEPPDNSDPSGLSLRLSAGRGRHLVVRLRNGSVPAFDEHHREVLARALERSAITRPTSDFDPTGKFARYNFPGVLDRAGAIEVVRSPPGPGAPTP